MGLRVNKRIKIAKGLYINVGKKGVSTSVKVGNMTLNSKGTVTASIPNTGVSYRANLKSKSNNKSKQTTINHRKQANANVDPVTLERTTVFFQTFLFGMFGLHYFAVGNNKKGILYLCTLGLFGVGWFIDSCISFIKIFKKA